MASWKMGDEGINKEENRKITPSVARLLTKKDVKRCKKKEEGLRLRDRPENPSETRRKPIESDKKWRKGKEGAKREGNDEI